MQNLMQDLVPANGESDHELEDAEEE